MLRPATLSDLPFLVEVEQRFASQGLLHSEDGDTHQRRMNDADCAYFIAEEQDAPVGYVVLRGLTAGHRSVELQRIAVAEPGRGHGRRALALAINKAIRG
jgi:diamine N-acetyltransferase